MAGSRGAYHGNVRSSSRAARVATLLCALLAVVFPMLEATVPDTRAATPSPSPTPSPGRVCATGDGVRVAARRNLTTVAAAHPAGTVFCLGEGTFVLTERVVPEPGDAFIGAGRDKTFIRPTVNPAGGTTPANGFIPEGLGDAGNVPITYQALDIGGFTFALDNTTCNSSCGAAIWHKGDPLTGGAIVRNVRCHDNGTACLASGFGSIVARNIECDGNGFHPRSLRTDYRSASCIKMSEGSLTLTDSWIHDNAGDAIWCDWCGNTVFLVEDNLIEGNGRSGVMWEYSGHFVPGDHAVIRNNVIRNNGVRCDDVGSRLGSGVVVSNGQNITIEGNTFGGNSACADGGFRAVRVFNVSTRSEHPSENVVILFNTLNGDRIESCSAVVTCEGNA